MKFKTVKIIAITAGALAAAIPLGLLVALHFERPPELPFDRYVRTWDACVAKNRAADSSTRPSNCHELAKLAAEAD